MSGQVFQPFAEINSKHDAQQSKQVALKFYQSKYKFKKGQSEHVLFLTVEVNQL
jgi:hypothetical protein